jgi:hypothetical protein
MKKSRDGIHEHVGWVLLADGKTELSRKQVFALMEKDFEFRTLAPNGESARVIRVKCADCDKKYLRTDADESKPDNLDELPLFEAN